MKIAYTSEQYTNTAKYIEDKIALGELNADEWRGMPQMLRQMAADPNKIAHRRRLAVIMRAYPAAETWVS